MNKVKLSKMRPIVYLGPSLSAKDAAEIQPSWDFRGPVKRGDLYQDRQDGGAIFVVIDGTFMQNQAISLREVVEVLQDGACIIGASSMGALRAAECWPAGMLGVGLVTRLYRMGVLESDDEVAVAVEAGSWRAASVSLVSVRYALSKAVRKGLIARKAASDLLATAIGMFYPERIWPHILRKSGYRDIDGRLLRFCSNLDIKRIDGVKAIDFAARMCATKADVFKQCARKTNEPFITSEQTRELSYDPLLGVPLNKLMPELIRWLVGSGRCAFNPDLQALWGKIVSSADFDSELMRWHSVSAAAREALRLRLSVRQRDDYQARSEIAIGHGFCTWQELCMRKKKSPVFKWIVKARETLALAKRMRDKLFNPSAAQSGLAIWG